MNSFLQALIEDGKDNPSDGKSLKVRNPVVQHLTHIGQRTSSFTLLALAVAPQLLLHVSLALENSHCTYQVSSCPPHQHITQTH